MGASFLSIGLLISSLTKNQIVAGMVTFAVLLLLWTMNWMSESAGPMMQKVLSALSITDHFDDFSKGVIALQSSGLLPELHHVRVVPDREIGRQRTLARVSLHA